MSERTFRHILLFVGIIWIVFVLVPALLDFVPRAWTALQFVLPGKRPMVIVLVQDRRTGSPIAGARVQILLEDRSLAATTNDEGEAFFEAVPAGRAQLLRVQKVDYDAVHLDRPAIPARQRARFKISLEYHADRRLYIAHDSTSGARGISVLDTASLLPMSPPGEQGLWDGLAPRNMLLSPDGAYLYVISGDRLLALHTYMGSVQTELRAALRPRAMGLSPDGATVYVYSLPAQATGLPRLDAFNVRNMTVRATQSMLLQGNTVHLVASPDGQRLYVATDNRSEITALDARSLTYTTVLTVADTVRDMILSRDGRTLYVLTGQSPTVVTLDAPTGGKLYPFLTSADAPSLAEATRLAYAEYQIRSWLCVLIPASRQVLLVDVRDRTIRSVLLPAEPSAMIAAPSDNRLYIASRVGAIFVVSLSEASLIDTVDVRSGPFLLALR